MDQENLQNNQAFLVSNPVNIFYLTGFKTLSPPEREAWLLLTKKNRYLFTSSLYFDELKQHSHTTIPLLLSYDKRLTEHISKICEKEQITEILFESEDLKVSEYESLKKVHAEYKPTLFYFQKQRSIKTREEIQKIKKACELADTCLAEILPIIKIGITEKQIAYQMENWMRKNGYLPAFDTIVAVGANAASPHHISDDTTVQNGSLILIDFGVQYKNYNSDITRMISMGNPNQEIGAVYNTLRITQEKTVQTIKLDQPFKEIDLFCRKELEKSGLPIYPHSIGHGVGLELHEYPKLSIYSDEKAEVNEVFTIEPGIYIEGKYGMRIEDTVVMNTDGIEILTKSSKELIII